MQVVLDTPHLQILQSALYQTNTTVILLPASTLLVDPGWVPAEIASLQEHLIHRDAAKNLTCIFTHADYDHLAGSGAFSPCQNIMSKHMAAHTDRHAAMQKIIDLDQYYYFTRPYTLHFPEPDLTIGQDLETLHIGEARCTGLLIPGHTAEDMAIYCGNADVLVIGDYLSTLEFPFIEYSYQEYLNSLDKLQSFIEAYKPGYIVPGHGPLYTDYHIALDRIAKDRKYLQDLKDNRSAWGDWALTYTFAGGLTQAHHRNQQFVSIT